MTTIDTTADIAALFDADPADLSYGEYFKAVDHILTEHYGLELGLGEVGDIHDAKNESLTPRECAAGLAELLRDE